MTDADIPVLDEFNAHALGPYAKFPVFSRRRPE
jgi:hypothetical protein